MRTKWPNENNSVSLLFPASSYQPFRFLSSRLLSRFGRWKRDMKNEITYQFERNEWRAGERSECLAEMANRVDAVDATVMEWIKINQNVILKFARRVRYLPLFSLIIIVISLCFYRFIPALEKMHCTSLHRQYNNRKMQTRWRRRQSKWN